MNHGSESLSYLGPNIWDSIPTEFKQESSLKHFKQESFLKHFKESMKLWKPLHCPCKLCKTYINGLGFLQVLLGIVNHFCFFFDNYLHNYCIFIIVKLGYCKVA